jgi:flagellar hook-associated protein 1
MIGQIANTSAAAASNVNSTEDIVQTLQAQQQNVSGVSLDQETINMLTEQRAYQGAAMFISTVNQMMQSLIQMVQ